MLNTILCITGKPGLYKFLSRGKNMLIVESIDDTKKRFPAHATDQVLSLGDISIYTNDDGEVPLADVMQNIKNAYEGKVVDLQPKKASKEEMVAFFEKALPNYDTDRVRINDMRKVLQWYNILVDAGLDDFEAPKEEAEEK